MKMTVKLDLANSGIEKKIESIKEKSFGALDKLLSKTGEGNDFLGWIDLPENYDREEYDRIKKSAEKIKKDSEVLVVIGIGGSYLGTKAVENAIKPYFGKLDGVELIYAGHHLSSTYMVELLDYLKDRDYSVNVISKSGTTTEPAVAFRFLKEAIEKKYGKEESVERIYVTTDKEKGALKGLANEVGYETFVVPDDVGGRFSVLTAVGLLPLAAAGVNIDALMEGARLGREKYTTKNFEENIALQYALAREVLYDENKAIEILVSYEEKVRYLAEWWKQLFGESEGKDGKGVFPASTIFTTDLHSMGQMIQDGVRNIFETVISIENPEKNLNINEEEANLDGLNYIAGKSVDYVNKKAMEGTVVAHVKGGVPNIKIEIEKLDEKNLGELLYFFEITVAVSGYLLGVNPFNQPGVEEYKTQMFKLLGKPGY